MLQCILKHPMDKAESQAKARWEAGDKAPMLALVADFDRFSVRLAEYAARHEAAVGKKVDRLVNRVYIHKKTYADTNVSGAS
jgi:hypothetical protein